MEIAMHLLELVVKGFLLIAFLYITLIVIYTICEKFLKEVYFPNKYERSTSFEELIAILQLIINTELEAYENDIFLSKGSITNNNFESYYNDITNKIIENMSPDFEKNIRLYLSETALYRYIARSVKRYLTSKISGTT